MARELVIRVAQNLVKNGRTDVQSAAVSNIPGLSVPISLRHRDRDPEGHLSAGSYVIAPVMPGNESTDWANLAEVLEAFQLQPKQPAQPIRQAQAASPDTQREETPRAQADPLREELLTAHRQAKLNLPAFKNSFHKKGQSDELIHAVKVGFPANDGKYEWMWVSLFGWRGNALVGKLENSPVLRKDLRKGCRVQISEGQIFDWVITHEGKAVQGPYTEKIQA